MDNETDDDLCFIDSSSIYYIKVDLLEKKYILNPPPISNKKIKLEEEEEEIYNIIEIKTEITVPPIIENNKVFDYNSNSNKITITVSDNKSSEQFRTKNSDIIDEIKKNVNTYLI